ncbi:PREDICTED: high-energy light unresponsive protein 1-like [Priapulus caudatus]|uniref:High-energy light unresponsive protein 1-like n=1 Tax=Priapulus caudatus TaxID=37621 RepID=A0ABM1DQE0_PRICU|nr:PREDICTED: high-energy light unresponsive protein 1-like [Priapulus caudatus]
MAHGILPAINDLALLDAPIQEEVQMLSFATKLSGPSIGLTACSFFVIDRSFLLTICGCFLTYFVLIIQFTPLRDHNDLYIVNSTIVE